MSGTDCCDHSAAGLPGRLPVGAYVGHVGAQSALAGGHIARVHHAAAKKVPGHAHDWPFLSTLLQGSYVSRTRTREMEYRHGVSVYHPRDFEHSDEIGRDGGTFFGVQFDPAFLDGADRNGAAKGADVHALDDEHAHMLLGALYAALCRGADRLTLDGLVAELASRLVAPGPEKSDAAPEWLERAEARLRAEPGASLVELSTEAGVHATTLTRIFRRHYRCSVGEFNARLRAKRAFFAVVGSTSPLAEICHDAGFADQSHMTRAFRRLFAATPGQLRRSMRNG